MVLELVAEKLPRLHSHLSQTINFNTQPGLIVDEVFASLFTQSISLDCVTRLWDVWVFEGDRTLVRGMVAMLGMMEARLMDTANGADVVRVMREGLNTKEEDWMEGLKESGKGQCS